MDTLKQIFIDSLNGLSLDVIPLFLFQLLCAGLLGYLTEKILNKKFAIEVVTHGALIAVVAALLASLVKYSVPASVIAAAVLLIFIKTKDESKLHIIGTFIVLALGIGCGLGSVIQTVIGFMVLIPVILFLPLKK
ncbi:MAG: hypothetical protein IPO32_16645 [Crocinitomicaceae bacterium]|nr:hypothetical protein [Crocinitomicaceae bacterium]MBK6952248.1 hypothetical protein [Crocinitomicaceae bacterium]MBK9593051.1 hypothetical protein [Crocinitomicaceae bacterium]